MIRKGTRKFSASKTKAKKTRPEHTEMERPAKEGDLANIEEVVSFAYRKERE